MKLSLSLLVVFVALAYWAGPPLWALMSRQIEAHKNHVEER